MYIVQYYIGSPAMPPLILTPDSNLERLSLQSLYLYIAQCPW